MNELSARLGRSSDEILENLRVDGFSVLPRYIGNNWNDTLVTRLDFFERRYPDRKKLLPDEKFLEFITSDELLVLAELLLGSNYRFHHANGRKVSPSRHFEAKQWHHDFDASSLGSVNLLQQKMYHIMVYPNGLTKHTAPLIIKPKSHLLEVQRYEPNEFGVEITDQDLEIYGDVGLVVLLNSRLWHMRPNHLSSKPRYDINVSFCTQGLNWPERKEWFEELMWAEAQTDADKKFMFAQNERFESELG